MSNWKITGPLRFCEGVGMVYPVTKGGSRFNAVEEDELKALLVGWISVDELTPAIDQCVDVWGSICGGYNNGDESRFENCFFDIEEECWWHWNAKCTKKIFLTGVNVTHWMAHPAPPTN